MKKILLVFTTFILLTSCQQEKNAFVDTANLVNEYEEKKEFEAKYQRKIDAYTRRRDSIAQAMQLEATEFQSKASRLSQKVAEEQYNQLLQKRQFIQQQLTQEEQLLQRDAQQGIDSIVKKVKDFVKDYGKDNGYTYILGANDAGSVMFGIEDKDITEEVLKALNDAYKNK